MLGFVFSHPYCVAVDGLFSTSGCPRKCRPAPPAFYIESFQRSQEIIALPGKFVQGSAKF
jgi:hypothetical protein